MLKAYIIVVVNFYMFFVYAKLIYTRSSFNCIILLVNQKGGTQYV